MAASVRRLSRRSRSVLPRRGERALWTWMAAGFLLLHVVRLVPLLRAPIMDPHAWRQAWTYTVAYNFAHESWNLFLPRHDLLVGGWRYVGSELPVYAYFGGLLLKVFGDAPAVLRLFSLSVVLAGVGSLVGVVRAFAGPVAAAGVALAVVVSPAATHEFLTIQPDALMLGAVMLSFAALATHVRTQQRGCLYAGVSLFGLAVLSKPIAAAATPAMLFMVLSSRRGRFKLSGRTWTARRAWWVGISLMVPIIFYLLWNFWAQHITQRYEAGAGLIATRFEPHQMWLNWQNGQVWHHILVFLLPRYVGAACLVPVLLAGLLVSLRSRYRPLSVPMLLWLGGALVVSVLYGDRFFVNWYYMDIFFPPVVVLTGCGFDAALRRGSTRPLLERVAPRIEATHRSHASKPRIEATHRSHASKPRRRTKIVSAPPWTPYRPAKIGFS